MDGIPYGFIPVFPVENVFPNSMINSKNFSELTISPAYVKFKMWPSFSSFFMQIPLIFNSDA